MGWNYLGNTLKICGGRMSRKRYTITSTTYDKRGRPIAVGLNDYTKSTPLMKHFALLARESDSKIWKHSELDAVLKSRGKEIDSILVQRYDAFGNPKLARPCPTCRQMLKAFGVRIARYSTEDGIKEEFVEDM